MMIFTIPKVTTATFLLNEKIITLFIGTIGEGPFHLLSASFVEIYKVPDTIIIREMIKMFLQGELEKVVALIKN